MNMDYRTQAIRSSAVLTTSYVAGNLIKPQAGSYTQNYNQLILYVDFTKGSLTTGEVKVDFAPELFFSLPYDGQSTNFTVGKIVTGAKSGATGVIVSDTDSGASGTLVLSGVSGTFQDNEAITDNNSSPGVAVVNAANGVGYAVESSVAEISWFQEASQAISSGTSTVSAKEYALGASGRYRLELELKDLYIRVSAKGTGTTTNSLMAIKSVVGTV